MIIKIFPFLILIFLNYIICEYTIENINFYMKPIKNHDNIISYDLKNCKIKTDTNEPICCNDINKFYDITCGNGITYYSLNHYVKVNNRQYGCMTNSSGVNCVPY